MNEENRKEYCPHCENHCPADHPGCGRGVRYFEEDMEEDFREERHHGRPHDPEEGERHFCGRRHGHPHHPHPEWAGDPESLEGLFVRCVRRMHHQHGRFGSTQDRIIRILDENGGTMGQKSLQELMRVRPGSISEILTKMEEKGLIERKKDADDRRASLITLTTEDRPETPQTSLFDVLTDEEKENLKQLLKKVLEQENG
ncbi:MAG: MarR family transcriptional regulator [Solobacterium sp.]|nr:MarR family transcriptional regulator [Solobacterium sp.]